MLKSGVLEGVARYAWEISKRMILSNPNDEFVLFFDRPYDAKFLIADNVKAIKLSPPARHPILWKIWFDFSLKKALKKHKINVLFSPDGFTSLNTEIPQLLVIHDLAYLHYPESMKRGHLPYYKKMMPLFYKKAEHIVAVSKATRDDILKNFGRKPPKDEISIAYNALPEKKQYVEKSVFKGDYILYLGSIHPRKNIVRLIKSYNLFRERNPSKNPKLILAGRKAFGNENLEKTLLGLKYKDDIVFLGSVNEEDKYNLLREAKLFVYLSLFEGFGIPILEAMEAGVPILHSDDAALMEVGDGIAKVARATDEVHISECISDALSDGNWRKESVEMGKERVKDFSWEKSAHKIYTEIRKLNKSK